MDYLVIRLDDNHVTAARFRASGANIVLEGSALFELSPDRDLADVAARIATGVKSAPRVMLCLPPSLFAQRVVELPLKDIRKVREVLPAHLQGDMLLPVEETVFDALELPDGHYLALWAQHSEIAHFIELFTEAGLEPAVVTSAPFAWRYLSGRTDDFVLSDGSALAVITGGAVRAIRTLGSGEPDKELAVTLAALELSGMSVPGSCLLFGPVAALAEQPGVDLPGAQRLEMSTECAAIFRGDQVFQHLADLYAVVKACRAGTLPDFRRGDLAWTAGNVALRKQLRLTALLALTALVLLFAVKGIQYYSVSRDIASLNTSISILYREIFPTRAKAVDEVAEVKGEIRKLMGRDSTEAVLDLLKRVAETKGSGINGLYEAEVEGQAVKLKGDARSSQAVTEFKGALAPLMTSLEMGELKSRPDGGVTFTLQGTFREVAR